MVEVGEGGPWENKQQKNSNQLLTKKPYFASSVNAMRPEAIAAAADVPSKLSTHPDSLSAVILIV